MSDLKIKQISSAGSQPNSHIVFDGTKNVWQKIRHMQTFDADDLTNDGTLFVQHDLGRKYVQVAVYDDDDCQVLPDQVKVMDGDIVAVTLQSFRADISSWVILIS